MDAKSFLVKLLIMATPLTAPAAMIGTISRDPLMSSPCSFNDMHATAFGSFGELATLSVLSLGRSIVRLVQVIRSPSELAPPGY